MDPNKERREAVKRKTTQYLKRAEEIFITHLQDNLVKGSSHLGVRPSVIRIIYKNYILLITLMQAFDISLISGWGLDKNAKDSFYFCILCRPIIL